MVTRQVRVDVSILAGIKNASKQMSKVEEKAIILLHV